MACRHFLVHGRVQGVFYRASARDTAERLHLRGWVRNRADGSVELVACGEEDSLLALEQWLHRGPTYARVETVQARETMEQEFNGFTVRRDG